MVYFYHILHAYAWQHSLTTGMRNHLFDRHVFAEQSSSLLWSVSENPHNKSKKDSKDQESKQSGTMSVPGYQMGK